MLNVLNNYFDINKDESKVEIFVDEKACYRLKCDVTIDSIKLINML